MTSRPWIANPPLCQLVCFTFTFISSLGYFGRLLQRLFRGCSGLMPGIHLGNDHALRRDAWPGDRRREMRPTLFTFIHAGDHALLLMLGLFINHSLLSTSLRTGARALESPSTPHPTPTPACVIDRPARITASKASCSCTPIDPRPEPGERARAREDGHCTSCRTIFFFAVFGLVSGTSRPVDCNECSFLEFF